MCENLDIVFYCYSIVVILIIIGTNLILSYKKIFDKHEMIVVFLSLFVIGLYMVLPFILVVSNVCPLTK